MNYPVTINLGQIWSAITRDRSFCRATLRDAVAKDQVPSSFLQPGSYNGGFLRVTEVTGKLTDDQISHKLQRTELRDMSPSQFRQLYVIHRHYETTCD